MIFWSMLLDAEDGTRAAGEFNDDFVCADAATAAATTGVGLYDGGRGTDLRFAGEELDASDVDKSTGGQSGNFVLTG